MTLENKHTLAKADRATADFTFSDWVWSLATKSTGTFKNFFRHGRTPTVGDLAGLTFTDVLYDGDTTQLKDMTFADLQEDSWNLQNKS